jgi:hypothetical protein
MSPEQSPPPRINIRFVYASGWSIKDPMGQTVEVYSSPAKRPAGDPPTWPA